MTTFVLATANPHKTEEMRAVLGPLGVELLDRPLDVPDVDETGDTLEENALLKARALVRATGRAAIADDTGLFVDALGHDDGLSIGQDLRTQYLHQRADRGSLVEPTDLRASRDQTRAESLLGFNIFQHLVVARLKDAQSDDLMRKYDHTQRKHGQYLVFHDSTLR